MNELTKTSWNIWKENLKEFNDIETDGIVYGMEDEDIKLMLEEISKKHEVQLIKIIDKIAKLKRNKQ